MTRLTDQYIAALKGKDAAALGRLLAILHQPPHRAALQRTPFWREAIDPNELAAIVGPVAGDPYVFSETIEGGAGADGAAAAGS